MKCPKCNGKVQVLDHSFVEPRNEEYRKRKCLVCGHRFVTIEFEVDYDERFKKDWSKYNLRNINKRS